MVEPPEDLLWLIEDLDWAYVATASEDGLPDLAVERNRQWMGDRAVLLGPVYFDFPCSRVSPGGFHNFEPYLVGGNWGNRIIMEFGS